VTKLPSWRVISSATYIPGLKNEFEPLQVISSAGIFFLKSRDPHKVIDASHRSLALTWTKILGKALDHPIFWKNDELGTKKGV
jgi:hypothetical protein